MISIFRGKYGKLEELKNRITFEDSLRENKNDSLKPNFSINLNFCN